MLNDYFGYTNSSLMFISFCGLLLCNFSVVMKFDLDVDLIQIKVISCIMCNNALSRQKGHLLILVKKTFKQRFADSVAADKLCFWLVTFKIMIYNMDKIQLYNKAGETVRVNL